MKTATDILQERISSYNETVSDFSKIRFTSKELGIFTGGMEEYAKQFHPSPKEISEEEIKTIFDNNNKLFWGVRAMDLDSFRSALLSLPSSGSKTEAVELLEYFLKEDTYGVVFIEGKVMLEHMDTNKTISIEEFYQLFLKDKQQ